MTKQSTMNFAAAIEALRPLTTQHKTDHGERAGFLMTDATRVLGGLGYASDALAVLMIEGFVESEPADINGEVHTLYRLTTVTPPTFH